jgi:hypothetical protein
MTDLSVPSQELTLFDRVTSVLVGVAIAVGFASLVALAFRDDGTVPLFCLLLGVVVGAVVGSMSPMGIRLREFPPGPTAVAGEPVPLGALGYATARTLDRAIVKAVQLAAIVCLGAPAAALGLYVVLGERPSLFVLGAVAIAGVVAAAACATLLPPFFLDERDRAAFVVANWAGARECERAFGSRRAAIPLTEHDQRRWLNAVRHDSPRPVDVQVMVLAGELDAAREAVAKLPAATPHERFVKAEHEALVRYEATGDTDRSAVRRALASIPPGPEQIEAAASLAVDDARLLLPDGDWRRPLVAARDAIPERDWRILVRDHGWGQYTRKLVGLRRTFVVLAGLTVGLGTLQYLLL